MADSDPDDDIYDQYQSVADEDEPFESETVESVTVDFSGDADIPAGAEDDWEDITAPGDESSSLPPFTMTPTELKMALFLLYSRMSRSTWVALWEVLQTVGSVEELKALPRHKDILVSALKTQLPLAKLHEKVIRLDVSKIPTRSLDTERMYSFDLKDSIKRTMDSP